MEIWLETGDLSADRRAGLDSWLAYARRPGNGRTATPYHGAREAAAIRFLGLLNAYSFGTTVDVEAGVAQEANQGQPDFFGQLDRE